MDKILRLKVNKNISNIIGSYLLPQQPILPIYYLDQLTTRIASIYFFLKAINKTDNYKIKRTTGLYNYKYWCIREKTDLNI